MPGASIIAEPFCIFGRRVRGQLGPYSFTPEKNRSVPLKVAMMRNAEMGPNSASTLRVENVRLDDLQQIAHWAMQDEPGPVMVLASQVPIQVISPLMMAGQKYVDDLAHYSQMMVFAPYLEENGRPLSAFRTTEEGLKPEEIRQWKGLGCDPSRAMFFGLFDPQGQPFSSTDIGLWGMGCLLGSLVMDARLIARGIPRGRISENAGFVFTRKYHSEIVGGVDDHLRQRHGVAYAQSSESAMLRKFVAESGIEISQYERFLTPAEAVILASL
ncbi:hypothetical protein HZC35_02345 [Candidatus Saganbacteria bacterium]|nr:hypothetical protein [Candidatus Saganbacteria bacterium]